MQAQLRRVTTTATTIIPFVAMLSGLASVYQVDTFPQRHTGNCASLTAAKDLVGLPLAFKLSQVLVG